MIKKGCPECGSATVELIKVGSASFLICAACGYDESREIDGELAEKSKVKSRGPYRTGGGRRSAKSSSKK